MKYQTFCCALCQLSYNNKTTIHEIKKDLEQLKFEAYEYNYNPQAGKGYGQRAAFVVTTMPYEQPLVEILIQLGFKKTWDFERRQGYSDGNLEMWMINI